MKLQLYSILHVGSMVLLTVLTYQAFAAPDPARRRRTLLVSGLASLGMLVGGFGLLAVLKYGWPGWVLGKVVCWFVLSGLAGMAFRRPHQIGALSFVATLVVATALVLVYTKPF